MDDDIKLLDEVLFNVERNKDWLWSLEVFKALIEKGGEPNFDECLFETLVEFAHCMEGWIPQKQQEAIYLKIYGVAKYDG